MEEEMGVKDNGNFKGLIDKLERGAKEVRVSLREKYRNKLKHRRGRRARRGKYRKI